MIIEKFALESLLRCLDQTQVGRLQLSLPDGRVYSFGDAEPTAHWHIHDMRTFSSLAIRGDVGLGEAYAFGWWDSPDLEALTLFAIQNHEAFASKLNGSALQRLLFVMSDRLLRANSKKGSRRNIHAHYDISNAFYGRWLDDTMSYSAAVFDSPHQSLCDAQNNKYDRLLNAVRGNGGKTLEIGCGWGGFAQRALDTSDCHLTGITISTEQQKYACARMEQSGHAARSDIRLQDYRDLSGKFDAIVSIEMIEAVGMRYWPTYFRTVSQSLAKHGRAAIQAIIVEDDTFDQYRQRTDFIRRYTFPGGMLISPGQIRDQAARAGLVVENMFRFGKDYARTLRVWSRRFDDARPEFESQGMKQEFLRGWKYYLDTCAAAFEAGTHTDVVHFEMRHA